MINVSLNIIELPALQLAKQISGREKVTKKVEEFINLKLLSYCFFFLYDILSQFVTVGMFPVIDS